jgi:hypothetical protein
MLDLTDTIADPETTLRNLSELVLVNIKTGRPWKDCSSRATLLVKAHDDAVRRNDDIPITFAELLLTPKNITTYCDGITLRGRAGDNHQAPVGVGSQGPLADLFIRITKHIDPSVDVSALEELKTQAEGQCKQKNTEANKAIVCYQTIAKKIGDPLASADMTKMNRAEISKLVYASIQTFIAPTREKTLIYLRAAKANGFKVEEEHTREMLDALKSDHPTHADAISLCTVTFTDDNKPAMLYLGVHGEQDTMKSEFYHAVDMSKALFKDQADMVQHVHAGLSELTSCPHSSN